ncbi:MAG: protein O-mannosyl-transferase family [Candidatus Hydrothermia bacterium]
MQNEGKVKWFVFGIISFSMWLLYFLTTSPTIVFWDVGEFLACSAIFGVPHPPGTPLYVLLGRFMTILPLPMDSLFKLFYPNSYPVNTVLKITLIAMVTGAMTAGFVYLIVYDLLRMIFKDTPPVFAHIAGIFAGFMSMLAKVNWENSIEAETYTPANFIIVALTWLALKWYKEKDDPASTRYLIFAGYVITAGIGFHLTSFAFFPALLLFTFVVKKELYWDRLTLGLLGLTFFLLASLQLAYEPGALGYVVFAIGAALLLYYLYSAVFKKIKKSETPYEIIWIILGVLYIVGLVTKNPYLILGPAIAIGILFYVETKAYQDWKGLAVLFMFLGFLLEITMVLRAIHNPYINEADPSTFKAFMDVLTRKQYGPMNMLPRKIPLIEQLGNYWVYFSWQYQQLLIPITILAIFGLVIHITSDRKTLALVGFTFLILSFGFLWYLNLKDSPSQPVNPLNLREGLTEVRDRDYFYSGAYIFTALYAGIGLFMILRLLYENMKKNVLVPALLGGMITAGATFGQIYTYYPQIDRHGNYLAEDYAYNLLISPGSKEKCILFTNGDNDTFPLWADQTILGIGKNVIIANMSLLNTNWHIYQIKKQGAPVSFPDSIIWKLPPVFPTLDGRYMYLVDLMIRDLIATSAGYKTTDYITINPAKMFPKYGFENVDIKIPRVYLSSKEEFAKEVIEKADTFRIPIFFSMTVSSNHYDGWNQYLRLEGMAMRVMNRPQKTLQEIKEGMDLDRTVFLTRGKMPYKEYIEEYGEKLPPFETFRYRGVFNKKVYKDDNQERMIRNYASVCFRTALFFENEGNLREAREDWDFARELLRQVRLDEYALKRELPFIYYKIADLSLKIGDNQKVIETIDEITEFVQVSTFYLLKAKALSNLGRLDEAISNLQAALQLNPQDVEVYQNLAEIYIKKGEMEKARNTIMELLKIDSTNKWAIETSKKLR